MIEVKVSPFGSAVALDPARRVPRNDQPAPLAVLGGCRPGHDLDPQQVRPGGLVSLLGMSHRTGLAVGLGPGGRCSHPE